MPLPRSSSVKEWREKEMSAELWYFNVVVALNYLHGGKHVSLECSTPTEVQQRILDFLRGRVDCFLTHEFRVDIFDWREFLRTRSLSYIGEEVKSDLLDQLGKHQASIALWFGWFSSSAGSC